MATFLSLEMYLIFHYIVKIIILLVLAKIITIVSLDLMGVGAGLSSEHQKNWIESERCFSLLHEIVSTLMVKH